MVVKGLLLHILVLLLFWPFAAPMVGILLGLLYTFYPSALVTGFLRYGGYITLPNFVTKSVEVDGITINYIERPSVGDNQPTLVFIHGFSSQKIQWIPIIRYLPSSWKIVAIDLPGHGKSGFDNDLTYNADNLVDILHKVVISIGLDKFHIIGESLGSALSGQFTAAHSDMILSITMLCPPFAHRLEGGHCTKTMEILDSDIPMEDNPLLPQTPEDFHKMLDLVLHQNSGTRYLHSRMIGAVLKAHSRHYDQFYKILADIRNGGETREMILDRIERNKNVPSLIIWGKEDQICDASGAKLVKKVSPNTQVIILNKCGHCISVEKPSKCSHFIEKFINKHQSTGSSIE
jgi:abhydrolase domain-containing protein 6